ncbi:MAG: 4Fe-4S binding protein [Bacteroidota bacterium]
MKGLKLLGLVLFIVGFVIFNASFFLGSYRMTEDIAKEQFGDKSEVFVKHGGDFIGKQHESIFEFVSNLFGTFEKANEAQFKNYSISQAEIDQIVAANSQGEVKFSLASLESVFNTQDEYGSFKAEAFKNYGGWLESASFNSVDELKSRVSEVADNVRKYEIIQKKGFDKYYIKAIKLTLVKASTSGPIKSNPGMFIFLTYILCIVGAALYIIPRINEIPGIKNHGIFHSAMKNVGWLGILTGAYLISFYVFLYFYPEYMANWVIMVDPVSNALSGYDAGQFFLYGFLYTICILVMGFRMIMKYKHSKYQIIRTLSVMFFQTAFAFLIPEILVRLNQPYFDFKNIWPLDYDFFFDNEIDKLVAGGGLGIFMLGWGIALIVLGVPIFVYFFGKRWYCSWVCGCGGLAETLGDPYRQLSNKTLKAWKVERWLIHVVLVFAVLMTTGVLYTYFPTEGTLITKNRFIWGVSIILLAVTFLFYRNSKKEDGLPKIAVYVAGAASLLVIGFSFMNLTGNQGTFNVLSADSYQIRSWYGFAIGSLFSGVVGTGFYPLMGNRVWCRFGCPLAAYLGLVQRLKSRFRITTNGGQCISCGNCSTYCEMGIDVRWYAQRGQNIIRSSCVGCGVCSSVCPRGVLNLEVKEEEGRYNNPILIGNDSIEIAK